MSRLLPPLLAMTIALSACGGDEQATSASLPEPGTADGRSGQKDDAADELAGSNGEPKRDGRQAERDGESRGAGGQGGSSPQGSSRDGAGGARGRRRGRSQGDGSAGEPGSGGSRGAPTAPGATREQETTAARELEGAKETVRRLISGLNRRDPDVCDLFTQRYLEETTRLQGGAARDKCRADARLATGRSELTAFGPSEVNAGHDRAIVRFNLRVNGRLTSQTVHEAKQAGSWRIDRRN